MKEHQIKTPKRRFKGFTGEWEEVTLGDIADIVRGASPRPIQDPKWFDNKSEIGWLRISDVTEQGGRINYLEQRISVLGEEKTRVLVTPHLLVSIAATVGKPVINYVKTGVHDGFLIFLNPKFDLEFMFQWLEMFNPKWKQYGQPGSQVNLNSDIVKNQKIYLPNLQEQHKIGEFFSQLDERIELQKSKIEKMKALKKAYLSEMFPAERETTPKRRFKGFTGEWEKRKLWEVTNSYSGGTPKVGKSEYYGGNIPFIRSAEINSDSTELFITELGLNNSSAKMIEIGYILYALYGATSGEVGISRIKGAINQAILAIIPKSGYDTQFITQWLRREKYKIIDKYLQGGQGNLSGSIVKNLEVMFPSLEEQQKIGEFFSEMEEMIELHEEKLKKLQNLKQAYLNELLI